MLPKACAECGKYKALYLVAYRGSRVRKDKRHDLCFKCTRNFKNSDRAEFMVRGGCYSKAEVRT